MIKILILNGPNLNILAQREQGIYGGISLESIQQELLLLADQLAVELVFYQSNLEGELVTWIQQAAAKGCQGIVLNPAAYTHTSVALRDALCAIELPTVEVHISNVYKREPFRHHSYISDVVLGKITGFGSQSYLLGLRAVVTALQAS